MLGRIREIRGGRLNESSFSSRMRGEGVFAEQIRALFHLYCRKEGLNQRELELELELELTTGAFQRPGEQLGLW